jgi:general secretion pathway protein F
MSVALEDTGTFSPLVIQMVRVGEESGSLDQMMTELAEVYDEEVQAGVQRSLTLLEPALILVMGGVIAVVIIAILMGIMSVNDLAV